MELVTLPSAERDLLQRYGELFERSPRAADRFSNAVNDGLAQLLMQPESAPRVKGMQMRRLLLRRWKCGIFYRVHGKRLIVRAILQLSEHPAIIERRLRE